MHLYARWSLATVSSASRQSPFSSFLLKWSLYHSRRSWIRPQTNCMSAPLSDPSQIHETACMLFSHVQLFATPWTEEHQVSLSITNSRSLLKLMFIESVMPSNHFILCRLLFLAPWIFPSIRVFSNESALRIRGLKYWSFSFCISPSKEYSRLISFGIDR